MHHRCQNHKQTSEYFSYYGTPHPYIKCTLKESIHFTSKTKHVCVSLYLRGIWSPTFIISLELATTRSIGDL